MDSVDPFGPLRKVLRGMPLDDAVAYLVSAARTRGEELIVRDYRDQVAGGSVFLEGPIWTCGLSYSDQGFVGDHISISRNTPAGLEQGLDWIRAQAASRGPPRCIGFPTPSRGRPVWANLEWPNGSVTLCLDEDEGWDVREDWSDRPFLPRNHEKLAAHRARLALLGSQVALVRGRPHPTGVIELLAHTSRWVAERDRVLALLDVIVPGVPVDDFVDTVAYAGRALDRIEDLQRRGEPLSDGAFLVAGSGVTNEAASALMHLVLFALEPALALDSEQLTFQCSYTHEPKTREALPEPPADCVWWFEGPHAERMLQDEVLPRLPAHEPFEVIPACHATVAGAVETWQHIPPASSSPFSRKYRVLVRDLHPLVLTAPTGQQVHLNRHRSKEELLRYAHTLLAARIGQ